MMKMWDEYLHETKDTNEAQVGVHLERVGSRWQLVPLVRRFGELREDPDLPPKRLRPVRSGRQVLDAVRLFWRERIRETSTLVLPMPIGPTDTPKGILRILPPEAEVEVYALSETEAPSHWAAPETLAYRGHTYVRRYAIDTDRLRDKFYATVKAAFNAVREIADASEADNDEGWLHTGEVSLVYGLRRPHGSDSSAEYDSWGDSAEYFVRVRMTYSADGWGTPFAEVARRRQKPIIVSLDLTDILAAAEAML